MKYFILAALVLCLAACTSSNQNTNATATTVAAAKSDTNHAKAPVIATYNFICQTGKDTLRVQFTTINDRVQGLLDWAPNQKKGRGGIFEGKLKNDTLHTTWEFASGPKGMDKDTMKMEFLLKSPTQLLQKPFKENAKTGRLQTDEASGYTWSYKVNTEKLKPHA